MATVPSGGAFIKSIRFRSLADIETVSEPQHGVEIALERATHLSTSSFWGSIQRLEMIARLLLLVYAMSALWIVPFRIGHKGHSSSLCISVTFFFPRHRSAINNALPVPSRRISEYQCCLAGIFVLIQTRETSSLAVHSSGCGRISETFISNTISSTFDTIGKSWPFPCYMR